MLVAGPRFLPDSHLQLSIYMSGILVLKENLTKPDVSLACIETVLPLHAIFFLCTTFWICLTPQISKRLYG